MLAPVGHGDAARAYVRPLVLFKQGDCCLQRTSPLLHHVVDPHCGVGLLGLLRRLVCSLRVHVSLPLSGWVRLLLLRFHLRLDRD